jgi:hypothetical protein
MGRAMGRWKPSGGRSRNKKSREKSILPTLAGER